MPKRINHYMSPEFASETKRIDYIESLISSGLKPELRSIIRSTVEVKRIAERSSMPMAADRMESLVASATDILDVFRRITGYREERNEEPTAEPEALYPPSAELHQRIIDIGAYDIYQPPAEDISSVAQIVGDNIISIGGKRLELASERQVFIFNALLLRRGEQLSAMDFIGMGFAPAAKITSRRGLFTDQMKMLRKKLNSGSAELIGEEVIGSGNQRKRLFSINPQVAVTDEREGARSHSLLSKYEKDLTPRARLVLALRFGIDDRGLINTSISEEDYQNIVVPALASGGISKEQVAHLLRYTESDIENLERRSLEIIKDDPRLRPYIKGHDR